LVDGLSWEVNSPTLESLSQNAIFTNVALTDDGDVWWEGLSPDQPKHLIDWTGADWTPDCGRRASDIQARYLCALTQSPVVDSNWDNPAGVPITAIVFGGKRFSVGPLVTEAFNWEQGLLLGCSIGADQANGSCEYNPFAMLKFNAFDIGDYLERWVDLRKRLGYNTPKVYSVNWFLKDFQGRYLWPGYGENSVVLRWICQRASNGSYEGNSESDGTRTRLGFVPTPRALGMAPSDRSRHLLSVNRPVWKREIQNVKTFLTQLSPRIPASLKAEITKVGKRIDIEDTAPPTSNKALLRWVEEMVALCEPSGIHWCTGSEEENQELCQLLVDQGTFIRLNEQKRPNSFLARSDPRDVARVESKTWICSPDKADAGPTNNWCDPEEMKNRLRGYFKGCMKGRTMYVVPFAMGPLDSRYARFGVEVTDSAYVVVNMRIMTRMGLGALEALASGPFLPCLHSVGRPLELGQADVAWPCDPDRTVIAHFPNDPAVWSFGSGYGGNALLGKKCYALRIASVMARQEGWLAEHMLILALTSPEGKKSYICAGFPSACGKTNLAMLVPTIPGWTVRCLGDDICWMHVGDDGRLHGLNPEAGFFGVAPGTSYKSNPSAMQTFTKNSIFTNVGLTDDGDVWWEGMGPTPAHLIDWTGQDWTPDCGRKAAHPNSRYTTPASQCPVIDPDWENPNGVPISAVLFGGRRNSLIPLVIEAFSWDHGVHLASIISSELTAASEGIIGDVRRDPFGMLPFCGYNMGDYWQHWINMRRHLGYNAPKVFYVNWFRRDKAGQFIWPGFGENSRVLKWMTERSGRNPTGLARMTPIGHVPTLEAIDLGGMDDFSVEKMKQCLEVDVDEWIREIPSIRRFYAGFDRLPPRLSEELNDLEKRLMATEEVPPTSHPGILNWVSEIRALCNPQHVHWCTGTDQESAELSQLLVTAGSFTKLNEKLRPNSFLARSDPRDVARVESKTFICSVDKADAGPTNNWVDPKEMKAKLTEYFKGCMTGRTMYIIPFCMGPIGSPYSRYGVEITDSAYVVVNMKIMTRIGRPVLEHMGDLDFFLKCLHSVGAPLAPGARDVPWPCNPEKTVIAHFPEEPSVWSFGSGYGGNALLGKKCYALRIASVLGRREGWLAEHMLIMSLTSPAGKKYYIAAAFPSACGKTNLAMLVPSLPGWTVRCVGDDIGWFHIGADGRLYGINPESGFFGVAPGTSTKSNYSAIMTVRANSIFTNVALTPDGDVWWEGLGPAPPHLTDWTGEPWTPDCGRKAAHPNSRYTTPASQCPVIDPQWDNPEGVPICAIIFGGRRDSVVPLVTEAMMWEQGVFMASILSSEQTAAAEGKIGEVRRDPFAMLPFCGYNMADYWQHWINMRKRMGYLSPKIFYVNWFQRDQSGFLWPGFGENARVLKWITERVDGFGKARTTPIGYVPTSDAIDIGGLEVSQSQMNQLLRVSAEDWLKELPSIEKYHAQFDRLPEALKLSLRQLRERLEASQSAPTTNKALLDWVAKVQFFLTAGRGIVQAGEGPLDHRREGGVQPALRPVGSPGHLQAAQPQDPAQQLRLPHQP
jgi:phosphoenolpyruvate carboxykinase (GTP)